MSTAATLTHETTSGRAAACPDCAEQVLHRYTDAQRLVTLDAEPVRDGVYRLDRLGRAVRRSLVVMSQELRAHIGEGYSVHECTGPRDGLWYERD